MTISYYDKLNHKKLRKNVVENRIKAGLDATMLVVMDYKDYKNLEENQQHVRKNG